jgi:hypothetical protein
MAIDPNTPGGNEAHRLDDIDQRLYRRDLAGRKEKRFDSLSAHKDTVRRVWEPVAQKTQKAGTALAHPTFFKKFFLFSVGFAVLAALVVGITFLTGGNTVSNANIDIRVLGNSFAAGGEELPLEISVINKNAASLELADLFIEYERGGDGVSGAGRARTIHSLGTVASGKSADKNVFVTLYGEEGSTKNIDFTLQYRISGSNAIFVKEYTFPVTISSAPVSLTSDAPKTVTPNQNLTYTVKVVSNAKTPLTGMILRVEYPSGFKFVSAVPSPTYLENTFNLGDMAPGAERTVAITGTIYGQDGEDRAFRMSVGSASSNNRNTIGLTYNSLTNVVSLVKPFLAANLLINGSGEQTVAVSSGSNVTVSVVWANNLTSRVTDAEIVVSLAGNAIDLSSITTSRGFYDSLANTIIWNKTSDTTLGSIEPLDRGAVDFSFRVKPLFSGTSAPISQPTISLEVAIRGKQPEAGGLVSEISGSEKKKVVVSTDLGFSSALSYFSGPFSNTGPMPPKANQPTTYTVTWTMTNSANALANATAVALLPTYVEWVGVTAPSSEAITYDSTTRTVRWNIGQVPPGAGSSTASRTVSYQIRFTPSTSQIGSVPRLVLDSTASARDTFTGETISVTRPAVSTRLDNDAGAPFNSGTVLE